MTKAAHDRDLRFHGPIGLVPALVTLKDANFGAIPFDRIGRASSQMGIAAAFAAAKRSNKLQFLDNEGTLLHSTAPTPDGRVPCGLTKGAELGQHRHNR